MVRAGTVLAILLVLTIGVPTAVVADELPNDDEPTAGPGVTFNASDGPALTVGETTEFRNENPWVSSHKIELEPWGWAYSNGASALNITEFNGTWTQVKAIDATNPVTVNPNDKERITVAGDIQRVEWRDNIALGDGVQDFRYGGPSGTASVTLTEVPTNTEIAAVDAATGDVLDAALSDSSGNVTFDQLPQSDHDVVLQTYSSAAPLASNLSPTGANAEDDPQNIQLSADISDPDFGRSSDEVVVEFLVEGSVVETQTITSNQSLSTTVSRTTANDYDWSVDLEDSFGNTASTSSEFVVANTLKIYNESAPSELVNNATVDVTFYFDEGGTARSVSRSTSDGSINMTGLPSTRPLVVSASADGFRSRRIFIQSLTQQQRAYLLPESVQFTRTVFDLSDYTGNFPQETTVLVVERSLNGSYKTVLGDYFGANGEFPAELAYNERHRLTLLNTATGETEPLGTFTPLTTGEQTLAVSATGDVDPRGEPASLSIRPVATRLPAQNVTMDFTVANGSTTISSYRVRAFRLDGSNTTVLDTSRSSPGTVTETLNLSSAGGGTLKIIHEYETDSGSTQRVVEEYSIVSVDDSQFTLLGELSGLLALVPAGNEASFTTALAIIMSLLGTAGIASRYRLASEVVGLFAVFMLAAFSVIGWVSYDLVFVSLVAWGSLTFIRRGLS